MRCTHRTKPFFLVGARASGKSHVGTALAADMGWSFCDTDALVQDTAGMDVATIVKHEGWPGFRAREVEALRYACDAQTVIATGGGCVVSKKNREFMQRQGLVIFLDVPAHVLIQRLLAHPDTALRPALTDRTCVHEVKTVLSRRLPLYKSTAHMCLNANMPVSYLVKHIRRILFRKVSIL